MAIYNFGFAHLTSIEMYQTLHWRQNLLPTRVSPVRKKVVTRIQTTLPWNRGCSRWRQCLDSLR